MVLAAGGRVGRRRPAVAGAAAAAREGHAVGALAPGCAATAAGGHVGRRLPDARAEAAAAARVETAVEALVARALAVAAAAAGRVGRRCTAAVVVLIVVARRLLARDAAQRLQLWLHVALITRKKECDVGAAGDKVSTHRSCKLDDSSVVVRAGFRPGRGEQREDGDNAAVRHDVNDGG